jgi:hypothetical protein
MGLLDYYTSSRLLPTGHTHRFFCCIGGVVFLIFTDLNVSTRLQDDEFSPSLDELFFLRGSNFTLWAPAFAHAAPCRFFDHTGCILHRYFERWIWTSISLGESGGYSRLRGAKKNGINITPILVGSLLLRG